MHTLIGHRRVTAELLAEATHGLATGSFDFPSTHVAIVAALATAAGPYLIRTMRGASWFVVIAVAVADVGKFLFEEEVVADREMRRPAEARGSLTKFMSIMIVALSLEALVLIAKTTRETIAEIVYPALLVLLAVLALVGLGLFQRLSQHATAAVPAKHEGIAG